MKRSTVVSAVCALVFIAALGCTKQEAAAPAAAAHQGMPAGMMAAPAPAPAAISGKVAETMNAGGYTYVLVNDGGNKTWVAVPQTQVKVGQQVTCMPGSVMTNFTSPTLKRTFASIVFSSGLQ